MFSGEVSQSMAVEETMLKRFSALVDNFNEAKALINRHLFQIL